MPFGATRHFAPVGPPWRRRVRNAASSSPIQRSFVNAAFGFAPPLPPPRQLRTSSASNAAFRSRQLRASATSVELRRWAQPQVLLVTSVAAPQTRAERSEPKRAFYPNKGQWIVIWITAGIIGLGLLGTETVAGLLAPLIWGGLLVWQLSHRAR
jgi:hypothetical protein